MVKKMTINCQYQISELNINSCINDKQTQEIEMQEIEMKIVIELVERKKN